MNSWLKWLRGALPGLLILTFITPVSAQAQERARKDTVSYGKANPAKIEGYIVLLRLRYDLFGKWRATGKWPDDPEANALLEAHGTYWAEQLRLGRVLMTGGMKGDYWDNAAIIVMEAASREEAERIVADDPAVREYVFQAQVRSFDVHTISNKFQGGKQPSDRPE